MTLKPYGVSSLLELKATRYSSATGISLPVLRESIHWNSLKRLNIIRTSMSLFLMNTS